MAVTAPRTAGGLLTCRPVGPGCRIALVAPASGFTREDLDAGVETLRRLGFDPVHDADVFAREGGIVAGSAEVRARSLHAAWARDDVDAILAVRGGYGSAEVLPLLDPDVVRASRAAFIGYSDLTSLHAWLNTVVGITSIHGPMIDGRLARGAEAVDLPSFTASLTARPVGALAPAGLEVLRAGEAVGVLYGGTITQILASFGTPYEFAPPAGHILFLDEVAERPYRLRRMLTQLKQSGRLAEAAALVFGQMPRCEEPDGAPTARATIEAAIADFEGPVLYGFPSGHSTTPLVTLPFGVGARVVAGDRPALVIEEAAAG